MGRANLLKNGAFELSDTGISSTTLTSGTTAAKVAAGWYFTNDSDGGTNRTFTKSTVIFSPGLSVSGASNPKAACSFVTSGSETAPGPAAKALLFQRIYGTLEESGKYACFSFWAKAGASKRLVIEVTRVYGSGGSDTEVVGRAQVDVAGFWENFHCAALFPDYVNRSFGTGDYIQVAIYLQAGVSVFDNSISSATIDKASSVPSATSTLSITAAKFEAGTITPNDFIPELDNHFNSEFLGKKLVPVIKHTVTASVPTTADLQLVDPTAASVTLTLPSAVIAANRSITFKRITGGANTVTITRAGSDTIDGSTSITIDNIGNSTTLVSDGVSTWREVASALGAGSTDANWTTTDGALATVIVGKPISVGTDNVNTAGVNNLIVGEANSVTAGDDNILSGLGNTIDGDQNFVGGGGNTVTGDRNIVFGSGLTVTGNDKAVIPALDDTYLRKDGGTMTSALTLSADPTVALQAATKQYVDAAAAASAAGLDFKPSVRAATTANITLSGAQTIDGVSVIAGDRVLVKAQTIGADDGIYVAASGAWTRSTDADTSAEVTTGLCVFIEAGTANAGTIWILTTANPITLGSTSLTFTQFIALTTDSVTASKIAADAVTDVKIGNRTVDDTQTATGDTSTLTNLLSWIGNIIKGITGKSSWRTAPRTTLENAVKLNGDTMTGALVGTTATFDQLVLTQSALTYAATTDIDLTLAAFRTLALTGNVTFTTSNKAAGRTVTLKILADSSSRNFTFPAWIFVGAAAPASIAANKTAILTVTFFGTADTDGIAAYAVQP